MERDTLEFIIGTIILIAIMLISGYLIYRYIKSILNEQNRRVSKKAQSKMAVK